MAVELHAACPVLVAEFAFFGLRYLRGEDRPRLLQAQGLHRRVEQHSRGIDGEDLCNLGKTCVQARVHYSVFDIYGQELVTAVDQAVEVVLH